MTNHIIINPPNMDLDIDQAFETIINQCESLIDDIGEHDSICKLFKTTFVSLRLCFASKGTTQLSFVFFDQITEVITDSFHRALLKDGIDDPSIETPLVGYLLKSCRSIFDLLVEAAKVGLPEVPIGCGEPVTYTNENGRLHTRLTVEQARIYLGLTIPSDCICTAVDGQEYIEIDHDWS
jgi:hypothetical protein